jgi:DNA-binding NtrC family response regulator
MTSPEPPRAYPRLFAAMNEVLSVLRAGGDEKEALARSFEHAAHGFGAEKALLLLVSPADGGEVRLRSACVRGLSEAQVAACESGQSVPGVSSSVIRAVVQSRQPKLLENPLFKPRPDGETPALAGRAYSVLCAPILDAVRDCTLAVLYFQNASLEPENTYVDADLAWLEGYASALGQAFAGRFEEQLRVREIEALIDPADKPENAPELVGDSAHIQALRRELHEVHIPAAEAPDPDPLLLLGEKGTGKDLVARYLQAYSGRRSRPFVAVNCAEISDEMAASRFSGHKKGAFTGALTDEPGLFRAAHKGVLFLDEIGELSLRAQGALLRALENRTVVPIGETAEVRVDVQVVIATNRDPARAVADGTLKPDLADRFQTRAIRLLPLRERPWDIPALARHFLANHERRMRKRTLGLTEPALRLLLGYSWPGNVREVDRVCSLLVTWAKGGQRIDDALLKRVHPALAVATPNPKAQPLLFEDQSLRDAVRSFERELILARLERHGWNIRGARESLDVPRSSFHRYMTALDIVAPASVTPVAEE